jgi:hypothetical protein
MPIREFRCYFCSGYKEVIHPSLDPDKVPIPDCPQCGMSMERLISLPRIDTSSTFKPFSYRGPDGRRWQIDNLHALRGVEHSYSQTGHNVRFDAYSAEPSNPDTVDGMGMPYAGEDGQQTTSKSVDLGGKT